MEELIGHRVSIIFNLPSSEWPINGSPAFATVDDVCMPMIKLEGQWINVSIIRTISLWE